MAVYKPVRRGRIRQGELLSGVVQIVRESPVSTSGMVRPIVHPYAIVLTQDCDLEQDYRRRKEHEASNLPSILLAMCEEFSAFKATLPSGSEFLKRVKNNKDERYHCLEDVPVNLDAAGAGLPALGIDFKRCFTLPTGDLYEQIHASAFSRHARLSTPYAEHLNSRFGFFISRIALPLDHSMPA